MAFTMGELLVKLGFSADIKPLNDLRKGLKDLPVDVLTGIAALAGIEYSLVKFSQEAMNAAAGFQMFKSQTGLSWQELQRWQIVAEQANVSAETVATSITTLQRNLAEIRLGGGNRRPYQLMGIGVENQDAFAVLNQVRQRIKGYDNATATNLISQMGLGPEFIQVLRLSDKEFAQFTNNVHGMTGQQYQDFLKMKQALTEFRLNFEHMMFAVVSHFEEAIEKTAEFKKVLVGVGVVLVGLAAYFFPVTAALIGLMLVLDDLAVYFTGGDSVVGLAVEGIKKLGQAFNPLTTALGSVTSIGGTIAAAASAAVNPLSMVNGATNAVMGHIVNQTNNFSIQSTAPAHAVADEVVRKQKQATSQADSQLNKAGA